MVETQEHSMTIVGEVVALAVDDKVPLNVLLRHALVLAHKLKNARLKEWISKELNGYLIDDSLPDYRQVSAGSLGSFSAGFGATVKNLPLPTLSMDEEHREFASSVKLVQPVVAYEKLAATGENPRIPWNTNLVMYYQDRFLEGFSLVSAWQAIPNSVVLSVPEAVRNRLLQLALDLEDDLSSTGTEELQRLSPTKVDQRVTNNIYGGNVVIAGSATDFIQNSTSGVQAHDLPSLLAFMRASGVPDPTIIELQRAIAQDEQAGSGTQMGPNTRAWMSKLGEAGFQIGSSVGVELLTRAVQGYFS